MKKVIGLAFALLAIVIVLSLWQLYPPQPLRIAGDPTLEQFEPLRDLDIRVLETTETRVLDRFNLPHNHSIEFLVLEDSQPSIAIFETGESGSRSITGVQELAGASPSTVWRALNTEERKLPRDLLDLYGPPDGERPDGWLVQRWLAEPPVPSPSGPCNNDWFGARVGTETAFPAAHHHFIRYDKWGNSLGFYGGYYQYAGWVDIWHGGICLQQEIKLSTIAQPGTAWYLWYYRPDKYLGIKGSLVTPAFAPRPGQWGHWIWYKCKLGITICEKWFWRQIVAPNKDLEIQFDMGMDWRF